MEIVVNSCEGGNTQTPSKTKQAPSRKNHFFTYNNYHKDEIVVIESVLRKFSYKGKIQSEVGTNGTPHLQGMIWCKKPHRDTEFKLMKGIHWEKLKDTANESDYCAKDETHDGWYRVEWGFPAEIRCSVVWNTWNTYMRELMDTEPDGRSIYWFWSHKGKTGKTQFTRWMVKNKAATFATGGRYTDVMNLIYHTDMNECNCVIFNIPKDSRSISYSALESIKDGLVCNMKSHTNGAKIFNPPHLIVFANFYPDTSKMMADRWIVNCLRPLDELTLTEKLTAKVLG
uniref:hypothetical protein n=4 Tax=Pseudomonadati TaxID=3379134 RepID=UPI004047F5A1